MVSANGHLSNAGTKQAEPHQNLHSSTTVLALNSNMMEASRLQSLGWHGSGRARDAPATINR